MPSSALTVKEPVRGTRGILYILAIVTSIKLQAVPESLSTGKYLAL